MRLPPQIGSAWNADRAVLRNLLMSGLEQCIVFGKKLERYDLVDDGVVAHFADGSQVEGPMLIGADSSRSQVRKQMLPDCVLLDTGGRAVFGKTPIKPDIFNSTPPEIDNGICLIGAAVEPRVKLFCDIMHLRRQAGIELPPDYVYWVLLFRKDCVGGSDAELFSLSNRESAEFAERLTASWHKSVRAIVQKQLPEAAPTLQFLIAKPLIEKWESDPRLTLAGDAAYPMTPVGGIGANLVFQDAAELLEVLMGDQDRSRLEGLRSYEQSLRDRANDALFRVVDPAGQFFGMKSLEDLKPTT